ncbi:MAG: alpha/beta hydrolase [Melioribacteraceae bacterium]|nr:alpha/beta hydrolase [Melioribacteraceae bacterium]
MSQNYTYITSDNESLNITTYGNSNLINGNCIIFVHGFKGFKDWGFGPYLAKSIATSGNFVITFNFSHNGVGENSVEFDELEKFANNTYSREINEVAEIVKAYKGGFFGIPNEKAKIGLLGHSRGGGIAITSASNFQDIDALVTWSAIAKFDRFTDRQKSEWKKNGYLEMLNSRTKQLMRLNKVLLEDIEENSRTLLNIENSLKNLDKPYLIIHGDQDLAVPIEEAETIYTWSNKARTELFKISGTGHTFDIKHPFEGTSTAFERVLQKTINFFNQHFNEI